MRKPTKALIAQWDRKLAKAGFVDAEERDSNENMKRWHDFYFRRRYTAETFEAKQRYFELATDWLNSGTFENGTAKKAWSMHAEGLSYREIGAKLGFSKDKAQIVIQQCQRDSGLRKLD